MFEKTLNELIRGVRAHPDTEAKYISQAMDECRKELRQESFDTKANAISKLCYMHMLGYDIGWAAFHLVEVMSSKKFTHKRIGYLAAAQSFSPETDVLMLTTNMIKKDLGDQNQYVIGTAVSGLAAFATPDLARDLAHDLVVLTTSTRPYVRKKATLVLYKIFLQFPDALRPAFPRLKDKLDDQEASVQSCSVNVICELARKNPKNYLSLAPVFFRLLTSSQNNWMRIKIIKLFAALTPLEPRLAKKLIEPLTNLIHQTPAMSLLYECIITVIISVPDHLPSIQLCVTKLRIFIEDQDQNLKYLGLQAMAEILKIHPKAVAVHKDLIISCLDDGDESIRIRALALIGGMCSKKNLDEIVLKLMKHLEEAEGHSYRDEVVKKVIDVCYQGNYQYVTDFGWYLSVLIQLTHIDGTKHGKLIASQMMDVTIRVAVVREFAVKQLAALLSNQELLNMKMEKNGVCEVLYASAYVCGEFASLLEDPAGIIKCLLVKEVANLPGHIQAVFMHNMLKIYSIMANRAGADEEEGQAALAAVRDQIVEDLPKFTVSSDLEVQERAVGALAVVTYVSKQRAKGLNIDPEVAQLFEGDLNPVAPKAQKKVPVPEGLNLDKWINKKPAVESLNDIAGNDMFGWMDTVQVDESLFGPGPKVEDNPSALAKQKEARMDSQKHDPFHLGTGPGQLAKKSSLVDVTGAAGAGEEDVDDIPVQTLNNLDLGSISIGRMKKKKKKLTKKEKKRLLKKGLPIPEDSDDDLPVAVVATVMDMPEGAEDSAEDDDRDDDDPYRALDINLDQPLEDTEVLPVAAHHVAKSLTAEEAEKLEKEKKKAAKKAAKEKKKEKKEKKERKAAKEAAKAEEAPAVAPVEEEVQSDIEPEAAATAALDAFLGDDAPAPAKKAKKAKKEKKEKKEKEKKAKKSKAEDGADGADDATDAADAADPASPLAGIIAHQFAASVYKEGGSDESIQVSYDTMVGATTGTNVEISLLIKNNSANKISAIELSVMDTDNAKVSRDSADEDIKVPFEVEAGSGADHRITILVSDPLAPQKLHFGVSYQCGPEDDRTQTMLNFKMPLPVTTFTHPGACSKELFESLLTGGTLTEKESATLSNKGGAFEAVVAAVCATLHLSVVEMMDGATSLYGVNTSEKHVCFLLKMTPGSETFSLDGKSSEGPYLKAIVAELTEAMA